MVKNPLQDEKSRSQVKREFRELKDLGIALARLSKGQLRAVPLSEETRTAVLAAQGMARNALQRQYRYLSSLLANEDAAAIRAALVGEGRPHVEAVASLHEAEAWRAKLLSDDDQLAAFLERCPRCDRTRLLRLVHDARKERELELPPRSARQLFRYLRDLLGPRD